MMLNKYDNAQFVNTAEAYSKNVFIGQNNVVIPYVNMSLLSRNPIAEKQSVIDYCYYLFKGVKSMLFKGNKGRMLIEFSFDPDLSSIVDYIMIGDYETDYNAEVKIECLSQFLYVPDDAKINRLSNPFTPIDTPNLKRNMQRDQVDSFFRGNNLPKEITTVLGDFIYALSW